MKNLLFAGRMRRIPYTLWLILLYMPLFIVAPAAIEEFAAYSDIEKMLLIFLIALPAYGVLIAVMAKRLRDFGMPGWFGFFVLLVPAEELLFQASWELGERNVFLLALLPTVARTMSIAPLILTFIPGAKGENRYGLAPKSKFFTRNSIEDIKLAAEKGDTQAQFDLGVAYYNGKGVLQDRVTAVEWWRMAAEQGNVSAQTAYGNALLRSAGGAEMLGHDGSEHFNESLKWLRSAAEKGSAEAQEILQDLEMDR